MISVAFFVLCVWHSLGFTVSKSVVHVEEVTVSLQYLIITEGYISCYTCPQTYTLTYPSLSRVVKMIAYGPSY